MAIASINPTTGETLKEFKALTTAQLEGKLAASERAFAVHRKTSLQERSAILSAAAELLEEEVDSFARTITLEMGKPIGASRDEVRKCATGCRYYAENGARFLEEETIQTTAARSSVRWQPLGAVVAIMPWNFPFWQVFRFAAPALLAGNVGLLKHAANVPQCALAIEEIFRRAGAAEGVFQTLLIESDRVAELIKDSRIMAVTLTGSDKAGSAVAKVAGGEIKKCVLELGGSDPFIVMPSADLERALTTAVKARTQNNGQSCIAGKRFLIADSIYDEFVREFVQRMEMLKVGDPTDEATEIGPLATPSIRDGVDEQVQKSIKAGAKLLAGGKAMEGKGNFYPPTVLAEIPDTAPAFREEVFGPVALLFRVKDATEAIALANDSEFGLGASVWTKDPGEQERFTNELEAGMVFVNAMVASDPRLPFGGVKRSGYGRELSSLGMREFMNAKTVLFGS
ncbi:MAG: NAD-dependent succinate-semialdehyde dehydrogenase [Verrucomicrobiota bacterium]|nr:NAD-dependent succinate-semialdehyde dehydrogenase [Chthoniobacterales bacterium]MDQ3413687.1 NAD-dependent succinate-semialdehyde dehydrogenase [Verrucomicrobiota bacterium]